MDLWFCVEGVVGALMSILLLYLIWLRTCGPLFFFVSIVTFCSIISYYQLRRLLALLLNVFYFNFFLSIPHFYRPLFIAYFLSPTFYRLLFIAHFYRLLFIAHFSYCYYSCRPTILIAFAMVYMRAFIPPSARVCPKSSVRFEGT